MASDVESEDSHSCSSQCNANSPVGRHTLLDGVTSDAGPMAAGVRDEDAASTAPSESVDWDSFVLHEPKQVSDRLLQLYSHPDSQEDFMDLMDAIISTLDQSISTRTRCPQWHIFMETYLPCVIGDIALEILESGLIIDGEDMKVSLTRVAAALGECVQWLTYLTVLRTYVPHRILIPPTAFNKRTRRRRR